MSDEEQEKFELKTRHRGPARNCPCARAPSGPTVLDIANLTGTTGVFTYDPGFGATASTESKITYIDGDAGVLLYRGYPVEQLAEKS